MKEPVNVTGDRTEQKRSEKKTQNLKLTIKRITQNNQKTQTLTS